MSKPTPNLDSQLISLKEQLKQLAPEHPFPAALRAPVPLTFFLKP